MPAIKHLVVSALVLTTLAGSSAVALDNQQDTTFEVLIEDYLAVQAALANDRIDGIADNAAAMAKSTAALAADFSARQAGVAQKNAQELIEILPKLQVAAAKLARSRDIEVARTAFGVLSDAMVSYRSLAIGELPHVAYCPMVKKSWLQNGKVVANPYYGAAMLRCGTIVDK